MQERCSDRRTEMDQNATTTADDAAPTPILIARMRRLSVESDDLEDHSSISTCSTLGGVGIALGSFDASSPEPEVYATSTVGRIEDTGSGSRVASVSSQVCPFWLKFPGFTPNPTAPLLDEIDRLANQQGWSAKTRRKRQAEAVAAEVAFHCDGSSGLERWQKLCKEVGIDKNLKSITQCKKVRASFNLLFLTEQRYYRSVVKET